MHCPEAALPVITVLATVLARGGQLNTGATLLHYRLQSTVYNSSTRSYNTFPLTAYFKNGQRWVNFPPLGINTNIFLTGRIFGVTKNNRQLAVITDDIHFLPTHPQSFPSTPSPTASQRKRQDRWSQGLRLVLHLSQRPCWRMIRSQPSKSHIAPQGPCPRITMTRRR